MSDAIAVSAGDTEVALGNVPRFARASTDRFFLCIEATDPKFERYATARFLEGLHPVGVTEVAP